jgi:hypothetical protein
MKAAFFNPLKAPPPDAPTARTAITALRFPTPIAVGNFQTEIPEIELRSLLHD